MPISEFDLIKQYFARRHVPLQDSDSGILLGIGDDAALLRMPAGMDLAVSIDTLVAGMHFPPSTDPADIGHKALAVNLSDMAAMGAEPRWATLALTLPQADEAWLEGFSKGFFALAERYGVTLVGGDTTRGPLTITVQIHGLVPAGRALRRAGARPGDLIYVTGDLGDAGLALLALQGKTNLPSQDATRILRRLHRPEPRIREGLALRNLASAAIDISDGLFADLSHILEASAAGATLFLERLPLSDGVAAFVAETHDWSLPLSAGDDYELCFTLPAQHQAMVLAAMRDLSSRCTCIGKIDDTPGLRCRLHGGLFTPVTLGYRHF